MRQRFFDFQCFLAASFRFSLLCRVGVVLSIVLFLSSCQNRGVHDTPLNYPLENIDIQTDRLSDIVRFYGEPLTKSETKARLLKYDYGSFKVTALQSGELNSIMIQTSDFTDQNGLSVGDKREQVVRSVPKKAFLLDPSGAWIADTQKKIIYWLANDKVSMLVIAAGIQLKDKATLD